MLRWNVEACHNNQFLYMLGRISVLRTGVQISPAVMQTGGIAATCVTLCLMTGQTGLYTVRHYILLGRDMTGRRRCPACRARSRRLGCSACWRGTADRTLVSAQQDARQHDTDRARQLQDDSTSTAFMKEELILLQR